MKLLDAAITCIIGGFVLLWSSTSVPVESSTSRKLKIRPFYLKLLGIFMLVLGIAFLGVFALKPPNGVTYFP
jgi:hypothetical protein